MEALHSDFSRHSLNAPLGKAKSSMSLLPSVQIHILLPQGLMIAMNRNQISLDETFTVLFGSLGDVPFYFIEKLRKL